MTWHYRTLVYIYDDDDIITWPLWIWMSWEDVLVEPSNRQRTTDNGQRTTDNTASQGRRPIACARMQQSSKQIQWYVLHTVLYDVYRGHTVRSVDGVANWDHTDQIRSYVRYGNSQKKDNKIIISSLKSCLRYLDQQTLDQVRLLVLLVFHCWWEP